MFFTYIDKFYIMASSISPRVILDANKLIDLNYIDWLRNLKIILTQEELSYILDTSDPDPVGKDATEEEVDTYKMWQIDSSTVKYIMLPSMSNEL